ncbi:MAG TPA: nucleotide exchange factor GrpE [Acidobacteriota bacterium]|nr:nucleotide exchange factor GrpE [Acidobacteriota bacterium]
MHKERRDPKKTESTEDDRSTQEAAGMADSPETEAEEMEQPETASTDAAVIEELKAEKEELYDRWLRLQAEFENFRRRSQSEKEDAYQSGQAAVIKDLLLVVDACEKGLASMEVVTDDPVILSFREGYELLLKQLQAVLDRYGVVEVPGEGADFDPNIHEAVTREETDQYRDGEIIEEYRKGYLLKDRLLRPAQVKVAVHP